MSSRRSLAASTRARDESYMKNLVLPYLGDHELRHIGPETLDAWVQHLDEVEGKAPATVRKAFQLAAAVLGRAVTLRKLPANPARVGEGIDLPRLDRSEMRFLSVDEVHNLADTIDPRYRALALTAAYSGLRWGELAALRRKRLDLDERRLTVAESLSEVRGEVSFKAPKSAASRRSVALSGSLIEILTEHARRSPATGDGLVFTGPEGGPLRRTNFRRRTWLPAVVVTVGEPCRFHDLRHTHAAWLIAQGEHAKTIQARLGHASISTTLDRYGHLMPGMDEAAAERLDALFSERVKHSGSTKPSATVIKTRS